jgi:hypothetical protein
LLVFKIIFFFSEFLIGGILTARRIPTEPLFQLPVVFAQKINVGLNKFQGLHQRTFTTSDVDVAEKRLNGLQIQRVVEMGNGRYDQPAYRERGPTECDLDHVPARLQLSPD